MKIQRNEEEVRRIRTHLTEAIATSSLRSTAAEVGIAPSVLKFFVDGGIPRTGTWEKLTAWERRVHPPADWRAAAPPMLAVASLVREVPPKYRKKFADALLSVLRTRYEAYEAPRSWWQYIRMDDVLARADELYPLI